MATIERGWQAQGNVRPARAKESIDYATGRMNIAM